MQRELARVALCRRAGGAAFHLSADSLTATTVSGWSDANESRRVVHEYRIPLCPARRLNLEWAVVDKCYTKA